MLLVTYDWQKKTILLRGVVSARCHIALDMRLLLQILKNVSAEDQKTGASASATITNNRGRLTGRLRVHKIKNCSPARFVSSPTQTTYGDSFLHHPYARHDNSRHLPCTDEEIDAMVADAEKYKAEDAARVHRIETRCVRNSSASLEAAAEIVSSVSTCLNFFA